MKIRGRRDERGQMLALFAVVIPGLLALMALGIDTGYLFVQHRLAQSAADLSALAGARLLPADAAGARTRSASIANANGYASGVTVTTPYGSDVNQIEVRIVDDVRPFFLGAIGMAAFDVDVRAVARVTSTTSSSYAVFAGTVNCGSNSEKNIEWSGSNVIVTGAVHSNSGIQVGGSNNSVTGSTTYYCAGKFQNPGANNTYNPAAQQVGTPTAWPITYTAADFPCTYTVPGTFDVSSDGAWWVGGTKSSKRLNPGVYCATGAAGTVKLSDSDITGNVTFVATYQVELSGSNFNLTAHTHNVLAYSAGAHDAALKLSGSGGRWTGYLYAPNGLAELSGSSSLTVAGGIVAGRVKLNGSNFSIDASALSAGTPDTLQLIE